MKFTQVTTPPPAATTLIGAENGLSTSTVTANFAALGQNVGAVGDPARLLNNREIPLQGFRLTIGKNVTGLVTFRPFATTWRDTTNTDVVTIQPLNNTSTIGQVGQAFSTIGETSSVGYNNAASSGTAAAFLSFTNWHITAGHVAGIAFQSRPTFASTGGDGDLISFLSAPTILRGAGATGFTRGLYHNPTVVTQGGNIDIALENTNGHVFLNSNISKPQFKVGVFGFNGSNLPTAFLQIGPSDGAAGDTPLKLTAGTLVGTPEDGAFEFDGTHLYFTIAGTRTMII